MEERNTADQKKQINKIFCKKNAWFICFVSGTSANKRKETKHVLHKNKIS